jgi:hypothetical protein
MSQTADLQPPIDSTVEQFVVTWDFGFILGQNVSITNIVEIVCSVVTGNDPNAATRLLAIPQTIPSPNTGGIDQAVSQLIGNMIGGTTYRLQCVVQTSDGQQPSLWSHLSCIDPD